MRTNLCPIHRVWAFFAEIKTFANGLTSLTSRICSVTPQHPGMRSLPRQYQPITSVSTRKRTFSLRKPSLKGSIFGLAKRLCIFYGIQRLLKEHLYEQWIDYQTNTLRPSRSSAQELIHQPVASPSQKPSCVLTWPVSHAPRLV